MAERTVIKVADVSKDFVLPQNRPNSVKSLFAHALQKRADKDAALQHALKHIQFEIKEGEFFGIVGRNGSGKSTLLKLLAGIYQPTTGSIQTIGRLVPFIELGVGFNPELTGRENVYLNGAMLGFSQTEIDVMYHDIVSFAELERFMDQKLKNYSSGMQVRLAFSMATRAQADILLIDEVLAVGDADFQRKCFEYFRMLKKNKKTVVFVSHDMMAVREYCDRAILIEQSQLILEGSADKVATAYTRMFIDEGEAAKKTESDTRWGDKAIIFDAVSVSKPKLTERDQTLTIVTDATACRGVDSPIFGFSIKNASGTQLFGTNNKIKQQPTGRLEAGERMRVTWTVPNIFMDGKHYVDLAILHDNGTQTADWWEEAAAFNVLQEEKTPYPVGPPIELQLSLLGKKS